MRKFLNDQQEHSQSSELFHNNDHNGSEGSSHEDHQHDQDHDHHHHHDEHDGHDVPLEQNGLWLMDNIELKSVGIDIGSSGTQVIFSKLKLKRMGEKLSSRYMVVSREPIYLSPVVLTPYINDEKIDDIKLGTIISEAYRESGLSVDEIDTGVVILTGEAIRRKNAQAIGEILAVHAGQFVCVTAGHNMEALLAAYGSNAAYVSHKQSKRILNIDIGGGTTKLAVVENGTVLETAALHIGGRLIVVDGDGLITRLDPGGKQLASQVGYSWNVGDTVSEEQLRLLTNWMADAIVSAISGRPLPNEVEQLFLTTPLQLVKDINGVMFSGGVGEYVYNRETRDFGDLGKLLGHALSRGITQGLFPWDVLPAGECIRATVVGASQYSLQVSGNTNFISDESILPVKNLRVLHPQFEITERIDPSLVEQSIQRHFSNFDLTEGESDVALAFQWRGVPSYERIFAFAQGIKQGVPNTIACGKPLIVILDGDIARTVGKLLRDELGVKNQILCIDGIMLQDFDFVDIGRMLHPSETVPVTVKSLLFNL